MRNLIGLCLIITLWVFTGSSLAADIENVVLSREQGKTRLVIDLSSAVAHKIFTLDSPERLVIDLEQTILKISLDQLDLRKTPIARFRAAVQQDKGLRLVMDLKTRVRPESFTSDIDGQRQKLIVDLFDVKHISSDSRVGQGSVPTTANKYMPLANTVIIKPGQLQPVEVSNRDVNYIKCAQGKITDRTFSDEKPLIWKTPSDGHSEAYFKLGIKSIAEENHYYVDQVELYITCAGEVYSLMLIPKDTHTQKIVLMADKQKSITSNVNLFRELDIEDAAVSLIDAVAYGKTLPGTFSESWSKSTKWVKLRPTARASLVRSVKPEGIGLIVHEYLIYADKAAVLHEFDLVTLNANTFAVRIDRPSLQQKQTTKAYLVERLWR